VNARDLARLIAAGRVALGAGFVLSPGLSLRPWLGARADSTPVRVLARAFGARDLVLGAGALATQGDARAQRHWLAGAVVADATDFVATAAARDELPRVNAALVMGLAAGAFAIGAAAVASLGHDGPAAPPAP
jgi:hypothetical protein